MTFDDLFRAAAEQGGSAPYPYQTQFGSMPELPSLLNVPTGAGKTATEIPGWVCRFASHVPNDSRQEAHGAMNCTDSRVLQLRGCSPVQFANLPGEPVILQLACDHAD